MIVTTNIKSFKKTMDNIIDYSNGFIDGVHQGKKVFLNNLGQSVIAALGQYIDMQARLNPRALHHVYEWYQEGNRNARLFNLTYTVSNLGLSVNSTFRQSLSLSQESTAPFYNKASIMENGIPVLIKPKKTVLAFEKAGKTVFTRKPVTVRDPGGEEVQGSYERVFDEFMLSYFRQSFIKASGLYNYINKPTLFKRNIKAGAKLGKAKGVQTGFKWIANATIGVEDA
jgi:hypothetical protein